MKKRILITGAAGFIGFHLTNRLQSNGHLVFGYDNFNSYYFPKLKRDREHLLKEKGVDIIDADIIDAAALNDCIEKNQITHIVHLAAQAGVRYSLEKPHEYIQANISGFLNILEACKRFPTIKVTYASSSSVYGLNSKVPFSENDRTDRQASLYGVTKKTNELMAETYHHLYNISLTGLRFFTVYGPWGRPDMACYLFTKAIIEEKPIHLFNDGKMMRDFTYIDDIVDGIVSAIDLESPLKIYNLGNHQPVELLKFVEILENSIGKKAIKIFKPMQLGDVTSTFADINRSQQDLKFFPKTSLEVGVPQFVEWYKKYI